MIQAPLETGEYIQAY